MQFWQKLYFAPPHLGNPPCAAGSWMDYSAVNYIVMGIKVSVCAHWLIHQSTAVSGAQLFLLHIRCNKIGKQRPTEQYKMSGLSAIGLTKIEIRVRIIGSIFVLLHSALWSVHWHVSKVISNNTSHHAKDQFTLPKPKYFVSKYFTLSHFHNNFFQSCIFL